MAVSGDERRYGHGSRYTDFRYIDFMAFATQCVRGVPLVGILRLLQQSSGKSTLILPLRIAFAVCLRVCSGRCVLPLRIAFAVCLRVCSGRCVLSLLFCSLVSLQSALGSRLEGGEATAMPVVNAWAGAVRGAEGHPEPRSASAVLRVMP